MSHRIIFLKSKDQHKITGVPKQRDGPEVPIMGHPPNVDIMGHFAEMMEELNNEEAQEEPFLPPQQDGSGFANPDETRQEPLFPPQPEPQDLTGGVFQQVLNGTMEDFQRAINDGVAFTADQMEILFAHHQKVDHKEEEKKVEFHRCGIICNNRTRTYRVASNHIDAVLPGLSLAQIAHRKCLIKTVAELKKISYTRKNICDIPPADGPCDCYADGAVQFNDKNYCESCMNQNYPGWNKDPFILIGKESFMDKENTEDPECSICMQKRTHFILPTGCGCAKAANPYCIDCYVDWCEKRFDGAVQQDNDDSDEEEDYPEQIMQPGRLVPCPFCRTLMIPF